MIWGDNKLAIAAVLEEFRGKIDLIYIDPPFDVGADFTMSVPIGDGRETVHKDQSVLEMVAYRDVWGKGTASYFHTMFERLSLMRELLGENSSIWVHVGPQVSHQIKIIMDEVFGADNFLSEIVWKRTSAHGDTKSFGHVTEQIFGFSKVPNKSVFNVVRIRSQTITSHRNTDMSKRTDDASDAVTLRAPEYGMAKQDCPGVGSIQRRSIVIGEILLRNWTD